MPDKKIDTDEIIHILRNPYGYSEQEKKEMHLMAADVIEKFVEMTEHAQSLANLINGTK